MYSLDGVPLQNPGYRWRLKLDGTNPWGDRANTLVDFNASGRDGTLQARGFIATPTITLVVDTPAAWHDDLRQLLRLGASLTKTADPGKAAVVELVSLTSTPRTLAGGEVWRVVAVMRVPEVYWRGTATATYGPTGLPASGQSVTVFTGSDAPVRDAQVSVGGSVTGLSVRASAGTFFTYPPNVPAGTYLTFDAKSGRAWTGSAAFVLGTEVTTAIQNGPGPYYLEAVGSSNPATLGTPLVVTYSSASGATITVKGREAYDY